MLSYALFWPPWLKLGGCDPAAVTANIEELILISQGAIGVTHPIPWPGVDEPVQEATFRLIVKEAPGRPGADPLRHHLANRASRCVSSRFPAASRSWQCTCSRSAANNGRAGGVPRVPTKYESRARHCQQLKDCARPPPRRAFGFSWNDVGFGPPYLPVPSDTAETTTRGRVPLARVRRRDREDEGVRQAS